MPQPTAQNGQTVVVDLSPLVRISGESALASAGFAGTAREAAVKPLPLRKSRREIVILLSPPVSY
jgi:hypothetical protein